MTSRRFHSLLLTISPLALLAATPAAAQDQPVAATPGTAEPAVEDAVPPETTIIVTGTRRTDRTIADSPVPIDVLGSEALASSGLGETNKILNNLVPSFNFPQPSISDGTDVIRPASLRGLAPDQTLVLVNGKRRHVSSLLNINGTVGRGSTATDLNNIPALAIDRIEVLRDGASSQYGSDAIAGVINVRLRKAPRGGKAQVSYGKYFTTLEGVRDLTALNTVGGAAVLDTTDSRILSATYGNERKVEDGALLVAGVNVGLPVGAGFLNLTGEFRDREFTNRAGPDPRANYNRTSTSAPFDARELTFNRQNFRFGDPETQDINLIANAGIPLGADGFEAYSFATFARRKGLSAANWRQQNAGNNNRDYSVLLPSDTLSTANFAPLTPDGFLPKIKSRYTDWALGLGVRGDLAGWNVDLSGVYGHNRIDYRTEDSINVSYGTASPRSFDSGGLRFWQFTANLDVSRQVEVGFAKPLSIAFGTEYRRDRFAERAGQVESYAAGPLFRAPIANTTSTNCTTLGGVFSGTTCSFPGRTAPFGAQGFPGIPAYAALDVNRDAVAAYVEFDTDPLPGLTTTIAGRAERFSDFGSTVNGKLALRYELVPELAFRGSVSTGFRAPALQQQFFTGFSTNFISGLPVDIVTFPVSSPVSRALGARDLRPEESRNLSAGVSLNPLRGLTVTADYFRIKIKDRIVLTENLGAFGSGTTAQNNAVAAILAANNLSGFGAARFFINGLDTTTEGVDVVATYRFNTERVGNWSVSAAYNQTDNKIDRRFNNPGPLAQIQGLALFGRVEGIRFEEGQPKNKLVFSADGDIGAFGLTARTTRFGKVVAPGAASPLADPTSLTLYGPDDLFLRPKWITDLELRYDIGKIQLAAGANNLFDVYPTRRPVGPRPVGGTYPIDAYYLPYSGFSPFGFNGRFLYGRVGIDF